MTENEKFEQLTRGRVEPLILKLAAPTIISMLISTLYNMADAFFVGAINASASGAITVVFSYMAIVQAFGFFFGHGSGNYISLKLGEKNKDEAERMAATGFFSSLAFGFLICISGLIFINPLLTVLGSTETIRPYAEDYIFWLLLGAPYMTSALTLNNQLRFQGNAFYAMIALVSGGVLNIALDALFVSGLNMGTGGAGLATAIGQLLSFALLFLGVERKGIVKIRPRNFRFEKLYLSNIVRGGLPSLGRQSVAGVASVCTNFVCAAVLNEVEADAAIAALGIVAKIVGFCSSAIIGFGQGFQPVCGFNYGAKKYLRVIRGYVFSLAVCTGFAALVSIFGGIFATQICSPFSVDPLVVKYSGAAFRAQCLFFVLTPFITISNMLLQNIGKVVSATSLAVARQGLIYIPIVFAFGYGMGLWGLQISQAAADLLTFAAALPLSLPTIIKIYKNGKENEKLCGLKS